jgi:hypothetical protein
MWRIPYYLRQAVGVAISPVLAVSGFRFSKAYRWGVSRFHRAVYAACSTTTANRWADRLSG